MKIKVNFGFWDVVQFLLNCAISMQTGALVGKMVVRSLEGSGAPPMVTLLTSLLAILATVIITAKALFSFDAWINSFVESKRGRKYRIQILNIPQAWSIWLVDKSTTNKSAFSEAEGYGVFGIGFFKHKYGDKLFNVCRRTHFTAYRFWRFSVEIGKR
jgi:hypothetical protein